MLADYDDISKRTDIKDSQWVWRQSTPDKLSLIYVNLLIVSLRSLWNYPLHHN